jgi:hypothetical protein
LKQIIYYIVVGIGLIQIIGYIFNSTLIRGLGVATASSPLPIVFTEVKGVETFACDFFLQTKDENNKRNEIKITPEMYSKISGPYNRRNVYGAAISYGPVLPKKLRDTILNYALCKNALLRDLDLPEKTKITAIRSISKTYNKKQEWVFKLSCNE